MGIKVKVNGYKTSVESDSSVSSTEHYMTHNDSELSGMMRSFGIKEVEGSDLSNVKENFDQKLAETTGSDHGFFGSPTRRYKNE